MHQAEVIRLSSCRCPSPVADLLSKTRTQPLFVVTSLLGLFAIFKPYPSISDTSLYLALLPLYRHILPRE